MVPWVKLGTAKIPNNGGELTFSQRDQEFSIRLSGIRGELMDSRVFNSEKELSQMGCAHLKTTPNAHVLVGGLGMGYTLRAALNEVTPSSKVTVAELIPQVVEWNKGPLGNCAKNPLQDPRTHVVVGDVKHLLNTRKPTFDAILLDVDNGPSAFHGQDNDSLYTLEGIYLAKNALKEGGILAVWSAYSDPKYTKLLRKAGLDVSVVEVPAAHKGRKNRLHTIWLAKKGSYCNQCASCEEGRVAAVSTT